MSVTEDDLMGRQISFENYLKENTAEREGNSGVPTHQSITDGNETNTAMRKSLIEKILDPFNIRSAIEKVRSNKGSPGVDGMQVNELNEHFNKNGAKIAQLIRERKYKPQPIRRAYIPKEKKGEMRKLGIPTAQDRVIQEAVAQVLTKELDPTFSNNSFGFRPGRNCQMALKRCVKFVNGGYKWVVDLDLEKFFDQVPQSKLVRKLSNDLEDPDLVSLINKFLNAGVLEEGVVSPTLEGVPQGGPLSPVLSNSYLDDLDKELEKRGHRFVRYADDCMVFCKSKRAAERVLESITRFIEKTLGLKVNREKTSVRFITEVKYLGYGFYFNKNGKCRLTVHPFSKKRIKAKIKELTRRNSGASYETIRDKLTRLIKGWINHFILADMKTFMQELDRWMRRRIRSLCWHRWKRPKTRYRMLRKRGMPHEEAFAYANTRHGPWVVSGYSIMNQYINTHVIHVIWEFTSFSHSYEYKLNNYKRKLAERRNIPLDLAVYIN